MHWIHFILLVQCLCSWSLGLHQEIIKGREKITDGYKESYEAELAYLTERHGFVDDENVQHSGVYEDPRTGVRHYLNPAEKFLHQFTSRYVEGADAYFTRITQRYFERPARTMRLCPTYLRDPFFDHNQIESLLDTRKYPTSYELKLVEFQYFTRKIELAKVVRCPVKVDDFVTRLHILEINHWLDFAGPLRGYFVFINKVVPLDVKSRQPLQLLMYVSPPANYFPEMKTEGEEAKLQDAVDLVSSRTMKLRLRERKPQKSSLFEPWTAKTMIERMNDNQSGYKHYFGEEAEIMLLSAFYGFFEFPERRVRLWRWKKVLSTLDRMGEDFAIDREKMDAVRKIEPKKSCQNYILLNAELKKRKIVPRKRGARYVKKTVNFTKFVYVAGTRSREVLRCPIKFGEEEQLRNIYLLPIHYLNSAKISQLFTFFEDPNNRQILQVYLLSPVPPNVDEIDLSLLDQNLIDLTGDISTSGTPHIVTDSDPEISRTITTDLSTISLSGPFGSDGASSSTGPVGSDIAALLAELFSAAPASTVAVPTVPLSTTSPSRTPLYSAPVHSELDYSSTNIPPLYPQDSVTATSTIPGVSDSAPLLAGSIRSHIDAPPTAPDSGTDSVYARPEDTDVYASPESTDSAPLLPRPTISHSDSLPQYSFGQFEGR